MFKRKEKKTDDLFISEGVKLRPDSWKQEENRLFTLLIKGLLVYLIVMGGIGCYLSSLSVNYSWIAVHIAVFLGAVFCSCLYYSKLWENLGYFVLLFIMLVVGLAFRSYISSGFFAVANELGEQASVYFNSAAVRLFAEQVSNRYLAVTISMSYIGWGMCVLLNVFISRRMQYIIAVPLVFVVLFFPLYIDMEPSPFYVAMLFSGLIGAYALRGNGHYGLSTKNDCYTFSMKKKKISYIYASRTVISAVLVLLVSSVFLAEAISVIYPKKMYETTRTKSQMKENSEDVVQNFMMLGIMGLFNFYPNTGGLMSGRLGGVSSISLDYEPDLKVEYTPYNSERLYLKTYTGADYQPYTNRWQRQTDSKGNPVREQVDVTATTRKNDFEKGNKDSAKARMKVTNVAAAIGVYLPYYSEDILGVTYPNRTEEYTYYPPVGKISPIKENINEKEWLNVPQENLEVIGEFCREAGLDKNQSLEEKVEKLAAYYRDNIPYTMRPGATPYSKDFVNYFLKENKRGYCAHYASASTLILRYLGVPARYIEGYAVDPIDISEEGTVLTDKSYQDYYEGYNPLGETEVISVDVSDANAHAWVEIYDSSLGWVTVELTPPSRESGISGMSMLQRLMQLFRDSSNGEAANQSDVDINNNPVMNEATGRISVLAVGAVIVIAVFVVFLIWLMRRMRTAYAYAHASRNDQIIIDYGKMIHRLSKKTDISSCSNYREQVSWLDENGYLQLDESQREEVIDILQRAGFSDREVSETEQEQIKMLLNGIKRKK